jgi:hypothetical protein
MSGSDDNIQEDWDDFVASVGNSANPITHPLPLPHNTVRLNTLLMSNHGSNSKTQEWESFLASIHAPVKALTMPLLASESMSRPNTRSCRVSPDTEEWASFLASVPKVLATSGQAYDSEPPIFVSEPPPQDSSGNDYCPSLVSSPALYKPAGDGDGQCQCGCAIPWIGPFSHSLR